MKRISDHISYKEATRSNTATKHGITNAPTEAQLISMEVLAEKIFEPVRTHFGVPLYISSFFRSGDLNKRIGGSSTSQHCMGQAVDIDADVYGKVTNKEIFDYIAENLDYDQLIWEFGSDKEPAWIHVSYVSPFDNRNRKLRANKVNSRSAYTILV